MESAAVSHSTYTVRVTKDYLMFCSGHFITYNGDHCERIHGHNYRVAVEVDGVLDHNHYVFDFLALRDLTKAITDELDHRMLLPTLSELLVLSDDGSNWKISYKDRFWSFPKDDCFLLPVPNTTSELLADYISTRLRYDFTTHNHTPPVRLRVEVEECSGQSAMVEWHPG